MATPDISQPLDGCSVLRHLVGGRQKNRLQ
jgi:hypothetical protein